MNFETHKSNLRKLKEEHRLVDQEIAILTEETPYDQLAVQRLKRRKLYLKDKILKLEMLTVPDIIA